MKIGLIDNILQRIIIKRRCDGYYLRWYYNGWHYWFFYPGQISMKTEGEDYRTIGTRKITMSSGQISRNQINAIRSIMNTREVSLLTDDGWMNIRIEPGTVNVYNHATTGNELELTAIVGSRENYFSPVASVPTSNSIFDNPLYNPNAIVIEHHAEDGSFTIILEGDGTVTIEWGDGSTDTYVLVPGVPQTITHDYPSPLADSYVITIDGEDNITSIIAENNNITQILLPPTIENLENLDVSDNELTDLYIPPTATDLTTIDISNNEFTETPYIPPTVPLVTLDETGNPLTTCEIAIGTQVWMCYNYASNYPGSWVYDDDSNNEALYGRLYTSNMASESGFCPYGWHVPSLAEWQALIDYVGGATIAGGKLKSTGTTYWDAPNTGADDAYKFKARGGGSAEAPDIGYVPEYNYLKKFSKFLTSTFLKRGARESVSIVQLAYNSNSAEAIEDLRTNYFSVRLIKNWATIIHPIIFDDWFLPSKDELNAMYEELYLYGVGILDIGGAIPSFWSSSEYSATEVWAQDFDSFSMGLELKYNNLPSWPCRSFTSTTNYNLRDIGPSGGWIFHKDGNNYMEACPEYIDFNQWSNITDIAIGTTGTAIGTGQANTTAIIGQAGHVDSAAKFCDDLVITK